MFVFRGIALLEISRPSDIGDRFSHSIIFVNVTSRRPDEATNAN